MRKIYISPWTGAFSGLNFTIKVSTKWSRSLFRVESKVALDLGDQNLSKKMCQSNLTETNGNIIKGDIGGKYIIFLLDTSF